MAAMNMTEMIIFWQRQQQREMMTAMTEMIIFSDGGS
jgi:hypothetical protein